MLVLSRAIGESVVIRDSTIATVALIGQDFVELALEDAAGNRLGMVTIGFTESAHIAHGVTGILLRVEARKARFGFEAPHGVFIQRLEPRDS